MDLKIIVVIIASLSSILSILIGYFVGYRKLKKELLFAYQTVLISKQMQACEKLWETLDTTSFTPDKERIIINIDTTNKTVDIEKSKEFIQKIIKVFNSPVGLYLSRNVRTKLFDLRNFICTEFLRPAQNNSYLTISNNKAKRFRNKVSELRNAIRKEIGVEDLCVTRNRMNYKE